MMTKIRWIIFAGICVLVIGALVFTSQKDEVKIEGDPLAIQTSGDGTDHVYGSQAKKVVLIEYGDFQCPGCGNAFPIIKDIKEKYKADLTFTFRHFPLNNIHPNALASATAAEAAGEQDKFYEMHDKLYENQQSWSTASADARGAIFETYAQEIGLNLEQFRKDLASDNVKKKIDYDRASGRTAKVESTPTVFLDGQKIETSLIATELEQKVQQAITAATGKKFE